MSVREKVDVLSVMIIMIMVFALLMLAIAFSKL